MDEIFERLARPFPAERIEWLPKTTNHEGTQAMCLAYIDARSVMERLDEVVGPANWMDEYTPIPGSGFKCRLSLRIDDQWVYKEDGADAPQTEAIKGSLSDALKRAAVKWGIGRYLYDMPIMWVKCSVNGKNIKLLEQPVIPAKFLPQAVKKPAAAVDAPAPTNGKTDESPKRDPNVRPYPPETLRSKFNEALATITKKGLVLGPDDFHTLEIALLNLTGPHQTEQYLTFLTNYHHLEDLPEPMLIALLRLLKPALGSDGLEVCAPAKAELEEVVRFVQNAPEAV